LAAVARRLWVDTVDKVCDKLSVVSFDDLQVSLSSFGCWRPFCGATSFIRLSCWHHILLTTEADGSAVRS
jgi:hypothetical protein